MTLILYDDRITSYIEALYQTGGVGMAVGTVNNISGIAWEKPVNYNENNIKTGSQVEEEKRLSETEAVDDGLVEINQDGDTLKASGDALNSLKDGIVLNKSDNEALSSAVKENGAKADDKVGSLVAFSVNQLETMYLKGQISKYDYDKEIERRDEIAEKSNAARETEEKDDAINEEKERVALNKEAGKPEKTEASTDNKEDDERKSIINEELERSNAFVSEMSDLNLEKENIELKAQNRQEVIDNNREELMDQIYNADPEMKVIIK